MNNPATALPRMARSFSTGSLQLIKQTEEFAEAKNAWDRWAKGLLLCLGVGGFSCSAVNTGYLYHSKEKGKPYWNSK